MLRNFPRIFLVGPHKIPAKIPAALLPGLSSDSRESIGTIRANRVFYCANQKFEWFVRIGLTRYKNRGVNCEWFTRLSITNVNRVANRPCHSVLVEFPSQKISEKITDDLLQERRSPQTLVRVWFFGKGMRRSTFQRKKSDLVFQWKGGRQFAFWIRGFVTDLYRKGKFSEEIRSIHWTVPDSEKWKVGLSSSPSRKSAPYLKIILGQKCRRTKALRIFWILVPDFAPNFAPNFRRIFKGVFGCVCFVGNGDQKKFTKNPAPFFRCKILQSKLRKNINKIFLYIAGEGKLRGKGEFFKAIFKT